MYWRSIWNGPRAKPVVNQGDHCALCRIEFQLGYRPSVVVPERMNFDATIIEPSLHCLQLIEEDYQRFITLTFGVRASYMTVTFLGY